MVCTGSSVLVGDRSACSIPWNREGRRGSNSLQSCFQASNPNPSGLSSPPAAISPCKSRRARRTAAQRVAFPLLSWKSCRRLTDPPPLSPPAATSGRDRVVRSEVTSKYEAPLRPRYSFGLTVRVDVSAERWRLSERFRVDKALHHRDSFSSEGR